ncbi:MAG TPA: TIR domain-containing protein, partial [Pirellulales bacterium]|nr:TIR domain-containing protein [Pirellulales bacterium]
MAQPQVKAPAFPQVFVSYSRSDVDQVLSIAQQLERAGVSIWRDNDGILGGHYYGAEIVHALAHSKVVLIMCSEEAFRSDNVHREILLTWEYYHRTYVPVWLSPRVEIPERFRYCLVGCQPIEVHGKTPEHWLPRLLAALEALGAGPSVPTVSSQAAGTDRAGRRIGGPNFAPGDRPLPGADWELVRLLGKGGYGEVWLARNPDLPGQEPVALKFCFDLDAKAKELLRHEADMVLRAQRSAGAAGMVPLLHTYLKNDPPCLEYPYIEGGTLVTLIDDARQSGTGLTPLEVQGLVEQIARIVGAVHRATPQLVHRDLKPSNVLVSRGANGQPVIRVTDFGIGGIVARPLLERSRSGYSLQENLSAILTGAYTPLYASPQQIQGSKPDPTDDVYSLGVIWYQLLTGDLTAPAPTGRMWVRPLKERGMTDAAIELLMDTMETSPEHRPA